MSAVETARSRPSDGELSTVPVEGERRRAAAVERHSANGTEARQRQRQLEVRHPDRVPGLPTVVDDEDEPPVGELPDCGPRAARRELRDVNALVRAVDGRAVPNEHGAAADRVGDADQSGWRMSRSVTSVPDCGLRLELRRGVPARHEHRRSRRDPNRRALGRRDDRSDEVGVRRRGRKRAEDDGERAFDSRRRAAPVGGEERDPVLARRIVEDVERAALPRSAPGSEEAHAADVEQSRRGRCRRSSAPRSAA